MRRFLSGMGSLLIACSLDAGAVSLSGRPTDDSVCDLSPMTNYYLTRTVFVPVGTMAVSEIYSRLALKFIEKKCKNSQLLVLHSEFGEYEDERSFRNVTSELCSVADVQRESTATSEYPHSFQVKCKISKFQEARLRLAAAESEKPVEAMIAENAPSINGRDEKIEQSEPRDRDCGKLGFGTVVLGLGGRCPR
ncbi:hypothetical protein [Massilia sp. BJB1822]|uniref:hypothetical protein n=1 Tax=Massilia sp. BJB1822 TaxID=2744470 RepID=UPI0015931B66|nr:hypothetical protein [Massilia sp. BJB1822]NVD97714.1 hypothetical protein [Massilia sp. BJB1822]